MKLTRHGNRVTVTREKGDPRATSESDLFYKIKVALQAEGEDVIKKEMSKDGHLVSDHVFYVRSRKPGPAGSYAIYDWNYALRDSSKEYNAGSVDLALIDLSL